METPRFACCMSKSMGLILDFLWEGRELVQSTLGAVLLREAFVK